jgi:hypothetical protein
VDDSHDREVLLAVVRAAWALPACSGGPLRPFRIAQRLGLARSSRISLNSVGPLRSRRFRCCRSSGVADESASLSICWPARSEAFDAALGLRRFIGRDPASPNSTKRQIASDRDGLSGCSAPHLSMVARSSGASRTPVTGRRPMASLPLFFFNTDIDFRIPKTTR